jgi:mono/diheme cytochrome c family protein
MKASRHLTLAGAALCIGWTALGASARTKHADVEAGRHLALLACTGCHVVTPDQPFKPIYEGPPHPPDFKDIANRSNVSAASLQHHLETLPAVPQKSGMPNQDLSGEELHNLVAFILSLRDKSKAPGQ